MADRRISARRLYAALAQLDTDAKHKATTDRAAGVEAVVVASRLRGELHVIAVIEELLDDLTAEETDCG